MHRTNHVALLPVFVALAAGAVGCRTVPGTGRKQILLLSESEEVRLGMQAWGEVKDKTKFSGDKKANALVKKVGGRIAKATGRKYKWEFKVVQDDTPNAFCLPGGKIAVNTGILPLTKDEAGLAVARHGGERISQGLLMNVGVAAVSTALGNGDPETVKAVNTAFGIGLGLGVALPFSRAHESEADRLGLTYMAKAGYHPREAMKFWERMKKAGGGNTVEFLSTHPAHETRIQQIRGWLPEALRHYKPKKRKKR